MADADTAAEAQMDQTNANLAELFVLVQLGFFIVPYRPPMFVGFQHRTDLYSTTGLRRVRIPIDRQMGPHRSVQARLASSPQQPSPLVLPIP